MKTRVNSKEPRDRDDKPWKPSKYGYRNSEPTTRSKHWNQSKKKKKK
jgi:hypothetical protein